MYIRANENIKNDADFRNLVTSIILRQTEPFREDDLFPVIIKYFEGSQYYEELKNSKFYSRNKYIKDKISETLNLFSRNGEVSCCNGLWYPRSIWVTVDEYSED